MAAWVGADGLAHRAEAAGADAAVQKTRSGVIESTRATRAIASSYSDVWVAAGVHPHQAADGEDPRAVVTPDVVAVGEIGLDFYRDYAPRADQERIFASQLELAAELEKPVIVHSRAADNETADMLAGFAGDVVLHCFSTPELLPIALERN